MLIQIDPVILVAFPVLHLSHAFDHAFGALCLQVSQAADGSASTLVELGAMTCRWS